MATTRSFDEIAIVITAASSIVASVILVSDLRGIAGGGLASLMIGIAAADARRFIIPDKLTGAALALGFVDAGIQATEAVTEALAFAAIRCAVLALAFLFLRIMYQRVRGRPGIGLGDVKLAGVAGAWLDWWSIPIAIEIAAVTALTTYTVRHFYLGQSVRSTTKLPFGFFFAPAIWLGWLIEKCWLVPSVSSLQ